MAEAVGTFQSQLSSVMETVFKAAMFEITRLVEDSFVEEVRRSRRQVESLREKLRRRETENTGRCEHCSRTEPVHTHTERNLKQEVTFRAAADGGNDAPTAEEENQTVSFHQDKFEGLLKEENLQVSLKADQSQSWSVSFDDLAGPSNAEHHGLKSALSWGQSCQQRAESVGVAGLSDSLFPRADPEPSAGYPSGSCGGAGSSPSALGDGLRYTKASSELSCLLINEDGFLQEPRPSYLGPIPTLGEELALSGTQPCDPNPQHSFQHPPIGRSQRRHAPSDSAHRQTQRTPHCCSRCGKTFSQASQLRLHLRVHCAQGVPPPSELKLHKRSQSGQKPYCCAVCGNKFSRLWNLKLHCRIHTQEKPHQCSMCEKSFTRADILKVHQRTHTGERPYRCTACSLSFKRLDHLKTHQRKHAMGL